MLLKETLACAEEAFMKRKASFCCNAGGTLRKPLSPLALAFRSF